MLKRLRHIQHPLNMRHPQRHLLINCQSLRRPDTILDLPPIQRLLAQPIEVLPGKRLRLHPIQLLNSLQEHDPDAATRFEGQFGVAQGDVDARLEGVVKGLDAVGGQEQDALEVLEQAEEYGDERVAVDVLYGALFEEDIGFVEEEDAAPAVGEVKHFLELGFEVTWVGSELASGYHV